MADTIAIDPLTGELILNAKLDRETFAEYKFKVSFCLK